MLEWQSELSSLIVQNRRSGLEKKQAHTEERTCPDNLSNEVYSRTLNLVTL